MLREFIYLTDDEIQLAPICEDCGPNLVPVMRKEELIRCKECKHHKGYNCDRLYGMQDAFMARDDDYCSRAERKDDD